MANFIEVTKHIQYGSLAEELDEKLTELVNQCEKTQRGGSITLTFKLKPGKGNNGQMEIIPVVTAKIPEHERGSAIMFTTPEGDLQQQDPRQKQLDLKVLPKGGDNVIPLKTLTVGES